MPKKKNQSLALVAANVSNVRFASCTDPELHCKLLIGSSYAIYLTSNFRFLMQKPIVPSDLYRTIRDTLLVGLTGYSKQV